MNARTWLFGVSAVIAAVGFACSPDSGGSSGSGNDDDDNAGGSGGAGQGSGGGATSMGDGGFNPTTSATSTTGGTNCNNDPNVDDDQDGFLEPEDCNDCDANVNPGAIEVIVRDGGGGAGGAPEPADEDCNGMVDDVLPDCDQGIALDDFDPMNGAKAIDLCQQATANSWGVIAAGYTRADGSPMGPTPAVGIFDSFGPNVAVQKGERMLGLSSGHARIPGQPGSCDTYLCMTHGQGVAPAGFPQNVPNCPVSSVINDDIALEVQVRAPTNATGYSFLFRFYSFEYPEWVCDFYNDQFIAWVDPPPMGSINGNISFDSMNNPVSVNIAFFDVCAGCAAGAAELQGTGFDTWNDAGGTSWLKTTAPINPGEQIKIRFAIWDTEDQVWDSTSLVDAFEWIASGGTPNVGTEPIPDPK